MVYDTGYNIQHKCTVMDYCILDEERTIWFCIFCRKVVGLQTGNKLQLSGAAVTGKHQKEYSDEVIEELK